MNKKPKMEGVNNYQSNRHLDKYNSLIKAIDDMKSKGLKLSKAELCKIAGVSNNYFSRYPDLNEAYYSAIGEVAKSKKINQTADSKDAIIISLKAAIVLKDKEIAKNKKSMIEHERIMASKDKKIATLESEVSSLKKQLEAAYNQTLNLRY